MTLTGLQRKIKDTVPCPRVPARFCCIQHFRHWKWRRSVRRKQRCGQNAWNFDETSARANGSTNGNAMGREVKKINY